MYIYRDEYACKLHDVSQSNQADHVQPTTPLGVAHLHNPNKCEAGLIPNLPIWPHQN